MDTEHQVVLKTSKKIHQLRLQFEAGNIFHNLSLKVGQVFDEVPYLETATIMDLPVDDKAALAKIQAISLTVKEAGEPVILDADLDFLLSHLAAPNPQVRDKGVYFLFNDLLHAQAFTEKQFHYIKNTLLSEDFLFYHILEPKGDGIFKRSFSVLILSALLYADRAMYHTFSEEDLVDIIDRITTYVVLERDGRGFIGQKGWGHVYTHIGNIFDELMASDLNRANKLFLLTTILQGYRRMNDALVFGEDNRLAAVFSYLANKDTFFAEYFLTLLKDWQAEVLMIRPAESETFWNRWYNRSRLLQAMIIRSDFPENIQDYLNEIMTTY